MKAIPLLLVLSLAAPAAAKSHADPRAEAAYADIRATMGFVPTFLQRFPPKAIAGAWQEMKGIQMNPATALSGRDKELIGLAVASQVPCHYCVYFHAKAARAHGATQAELDEAVALAGASRHWSAVFHGFQWDVASARALDAAMAAAEQRARETGASPPAPSRPAEDAESAKAEVQALLGTVPDFLQRFPPSGVAGAWEQVKALEFAPDTALPPKLKLLISIAVGSQVPCDVCLALDLPAAGRAGASREEVAEAVAMAALTRLWSTVLNGSQQDLASFKREVDRIFAHAGKRKAAAR